MPDPKTFAYAIAVLGASVGIWGGYFKLQTPEAAQCQIDLADKSARLDLTGKAMDACEKALDLCDGRK